MAAALLTPNEVAALAATSKTVVEKRSSKRSSPPDRAPAPTDGSPLHAVALAAAVKSLGRRLSVSDKRLVARKLAAMSPSALKTAEIEVAPAVILRVGVLAREAVERAERYAEDRDAFIEVVDGVQGGRPVIRDTRLTVSAIQAALPPATRSKP